MPQSILVVVDASMRETPAVHRAVELARRAKARLHLCMPAFDRRIDAAAELVHPDVERMAREQYFNERLRWITGVTSELASRGVNATCEVIWTPLMHDAVIAKVLEFGHDLVVRDLEPEPFLGRWTSVRSTDWKLARLCPVPLMFVKPSSAIMPRQIAAAVDPGHANARASGLDDRVLEFGLPLALAADARLALVHVFPHRREDVGMSAKMDELLDTMREADRQAFDAFADRHSVPKDRRVLLGGRSAEELCRFVEEKGIELLIVGSEYRGGIDRFFLGSTAEQLVAHAPCDLVLVRPDGFGATLARHRDLEALCERFGVKLARRE
ncbi:MAG TPA: universal stress protein [Nevskiaceae bacterium]|nr:universal stress protein [Nevskiaceae bacterium]